MYIRKVEVTGMEVMVEPTETEVVEEGAVWSNP